MQENQQVANVKSTAIKENKEKQNLDATVENPLLREARSTAVGKVYS